MKKVLVPMFLCAIMVLVAAAPLVIAGDHVIVKGAQGPKASAMMWKYDPVDTGQWNASIDNNGLRSLVLDVADNTSGVPMGILHQRIRFAAYDAYPAGVVVSENVMMTGGNKYEITATPNGPKGTSATVTDQYAVIVNEPPFASFKWTATELVVAFDASASTDDFGIASYAWDFGDGTTGGGMTPTHTYAVAKSYTVVLTVTDVFGLTDTDTQTVTVTVAGPSRTYTVYDMFMEPWGEWWPARLNYYGEAMIITNSPGANTMLFLPGGDQGIIYAPYRFAIDAKNWPGSASRALNIHQPEFMPVMGTTQTGLQATVDIYFQYLNAAWWNGYWIPTWGGESNWLGDAFYPGGTDGYYLGVLNTVTLNRAAAAEWLNLPTTADPLTWWAANKASYVDAWNTWILYEGNKRLDIYCGYAWTYDILTSGSKKGTYMSMSVDVSGNVVLNIAHLSWGYEVLMTRWLAETSLSAHEPWYEDFTMHVTYGETSANVLMDAVAQYSLHAVKATGTTAGAAWVWEPNQIDYIVKVGHPSKYKPYSTRTYLSNNSGDILFGTQVPYEQTPYWFNLTAATDKLIIQLPTGTCLGYKGVGLTPLDYEKLYYGDNSGFMAISQNGPMSLGSFVTGWPLGTGIDLVPLYNAGTKTLTITGPVSFNNQWHTPTGVLVHGAPWIEFNVTP